MKRLLLASLIASQAAVLHAQTAVSVRASNSHEEVPASETGTASYYNKSFTGKVTASGEKYDPDKMTAAHNRLPLGTMIKVTNLRNKRSVIVKVNDRLHFRNKRIVDLSHAAAAKLGYVSRGLARVRVEVLDE